MSLYPVPPYAMDAGQVLDEAEHQGDPAAIEAARRLFELEPNGWVIEELEARDIPWTDSDALRPWLDNAVELTEQAVGDREHLLALLQLLDTEGPEAVAAYVGETVRDWVR